MPAYSYKAVTDDGRIVNGRLEAANDADLELRLDRMGLELIRARPHRGHTGLQRRRIGRRDLIHFTFHLEQLVRAGVPILEGLADLRDSTDNPAFRDVISMLIEDIEGGRTLSEAFAAHPRIFDTVYVSLVRAGERSGRLEDVLLQLESGLKWQDELVSRTKKILMYPAFVATVVAGAVFFLMIYLVPQLTRFIQSMGETLPLHTRALIATSDFLVAYWPHVLGIVPLAWFTILFLRRHSRKAARLIDRAILSLWPIGPVLKKIILARFATTFGLLYASGVTVLDSLRITRDLTGNRVIREALDEAGEHIAEGRGLSESFSDCGLFPPLVIRMLRIGEESGELDKALANVSYFYDRDVRESIERVQVLIEPSLTVVLGLLIGWVMLSVLGPVYDVLSRMSF